MVGAAQQSSGFGNPLMFIWNKVAFAQAPAPHRGVQISCEGSPKTFPARDLNPPRSGWAPFAVPLLAPSQPMPLIFINGT